jgi:hypothetical protein
LPGRQSLLTVRLAGFVLFSRAFARRVSYLLSI